MNDGEYETMYRVEDTLWWYVGMRRIAEVMLGDRLRSNAHILDVGCGTGGNLVWLHRYGTAFGTDVSQRALDFCAKRHLTHLSRASALELPFPEQTFDLVTCFDVIYHLRVRDDVEALREIRRVLRPGGWTLIRVPALPTLRSGHDIAVHTRQRYSMGELKEKVQRAGLEVFRATYANTLLLPIAAAIRLFRNGSRAIKTARSDLRRMPDPINSALRVVMMLEARLLSRFDMPLGLSAIALARRPT
jgi:ubiquinone/menaquinone biosynthesis C-methylase UbiE